MKKSKNNNSIADILKELNAAKEIFVISHYNPDADAYGSSCAFGLALAQQGKRVKILNESGIVDKFSFVPGVNLVESDIPSYIPDLVVFCDCGDIKRAGDKFQEIFKNYKKVSIDHHISNDFFGDLNYVDVSLSSTCETIYYLFEQFGWEITPDIASCLLTGIFGDTGSFRYSSTSAATFYAAGKLIEAGAALYDINQGLYGSNVLEEVQLQSDAINNMKLYSDKKLAVVTVDQQMYERHAVNVAAAEGLAERARDIVGVKMSALIRWDAPLWKVSLRSRSPEYNVAAVAEQFGGGGHIQAAAFRWRESLAELNSALIPRLEALLK